MSQVGIRALKQNASAVVASAVAGDVVTITEHGHPVAQLTAIPASPLRALLRAGDARPPRIALRDLPAPRPGPDISAELARMRDDERY